MELDYSRTELDYSRTENDFSRISHLEYGISTLDSTLRAFTELWNLAREFCLRILSVHKDSVVEPFGTLSKMVESWSRHQTCKKRAVVFELHKDLNYVV